MTHAPFEPGPDHWRDLAEHAAGRPGPRYAPVYRRLFADTLTPVVAYRRLVRPDQRDAPSFLFESVVDGQQAGRYSFLGARPIAELVAFDRDVEYRDHEAPEHSWSGRRDDPLAELRAVLDRVSIARTPDCPLPSFTGGWVGYAGYDTVRYLEGESLPAPPPDDRGLPDLHFQLYRELVVFDHAQKTVLLVTHAELPSSADHLDEVADAFHAAGRRLDTFADALLDPDRWPVPAGSRDTPAGHVDLATPPPDLPVSNLGEGGYQRAVAACREYIAAGDAFQIVPSQRFTLPTPADPFDVYRALRVVNPSPYMFYLQARGSILVGSSPEVLCRVTDGVVASRPLAGTRRRGATPDEDAALEADLRADAKEVAEHVMLVDLHRNDVGRVARPGSVTLPEVLVVERYSHVMHLSSEVNGTLAPGLDRWDALRASLPVGTVSGAPKVRAMQIIDELEAGRRGPYAGAVGHADFAGDLDTCIALRTIVMRRDPEHADRWLADLQAGAGVVADSDPDAEHRETVAKAAALARAVALAEQAFTAPAATTPD